MSDTTAKADRCKRLLEDPDLKEAFATVRERYRDMIEETPVSDDTALLDIRKMLHLLKEVEQHLWIAVQDGDVEEFHVREQQKNWLGDLIWKKQA